MPYVDWEPTLILNLTLTPTPTPTLTLTPFLALTLFLRLTLTLAKAEAEAKAQAATEAWLKEETEARVRAVAARGAMGGSLHLESLRAPARSPLRSPARPRKPRQVAATLLRAKASTRA